jgi:hypothetical protein
MNYTNLSSDQEYLEEIEPIVEELQPIELSQSSEDPIIVHKIAEEMTNNVENPADDTKENSKYISSTACHKCSNIAYHYTEKVETICKLRTHFT